MIDYEKLKLAHELASKITSNNKAILFSVCHGKIGMVNPLETFTFTIYSSIEPKEEYFSTDDIDNLLAKLTELTQQKPKYEVGQTWWFLDGPAFEQFPEPRSIVITEENENYYRADEEWYPSKEALIDAQIAHWQSLREPTIQESCERFTASAREYIKEERERTARINELITELGSKFIPDGKQFDKECDHPERIGLPYGNNFICTVCGEAGLSNFETCRHEHDDYYHYKLPDDHHMSSSIEMPSRHERCNRCKKCGEFYK